MENEDLKKLREALLKSNWKNAAEATGISYDVIRKIAKGHTERPSYQDVVILLDYVGKK